MEMTTSVKKIWFVRTDRGVQRVFELTCGYYIIENTFSPQNLYEKITPKLFKELRENYL